MSILAQCAPSRWTDFLSISNNTLLIHPGEDMDLFVGKNQSVTIVLINGTETKFRDVVVLGELIIKSSDPENLAIKPRLIMRDCFVPSRFLANNLHIEWKNFYQPKKHETFRLELQELFLEWLSIQRDSVDKIGLKSILV